MKIKIIVFVIFLLSFSIPTYGQIFNGFGIKGGFTSSNIDKYYKDFKYESIDRLESFNVTVFKEFSINLPILLNTELEYSTKGFHLFFDNNDNVSIDCVSLKILAKYIYSTKTLCPFISIGPRIDYLLNIRADLSSQSSNDVPFDWENYFTDFSFGVSGQIGFEFRLFDGFNFLTEFSYNSDLSNTKNGKRAHITFFRINSYDISVGVKL